MDEMKPYEAIVDETMSSNTQESGMTRRGFLKRAGFAGIVLAATSGLAGCDTAYASTSFKAPGVKTSGYQYAGELDEGEWHHCACQRNCFDTCMMKVRTKNGYVVEVRGDENSPYTAGGLCVKTQSYVDWCYHDDRILYPLRRTGTKGTGCTFERISWDDAIDEITSKWKNIIDEHGGEAITYSRYQGNQGSVMRRCLEPLFFKMGATFCEGSMCNNGYVYSLPYTTGTVPVMSSHDIAKKDLYISWAHNPATTSLHTMKFIKEMNKNGGKIIVVNPVAVPETMWADLFVQLKPGTDTAFALGIGKYLIDNNKYDQDWIASWGQGFDEYKAECDQWPADKVAELCGIPEEQVGQLAELLWENRENACLKTGLCLGRRRTGGMSHISVKCLTGLVGHPEMYFNMTSSGGIQWFSNAFPSMQSTMLKGTLPSEAAPVGNIRNYSSPDLGKVLTSQNFGEDHNFADNPIRSIMIFGNNPLVSHPNLALVREGLSREDLFTVVHEMFYTPTCDYADIILPAPSSFEYEEFNGGYGHNYAVFNNKVIEPLGECMDNLELCNTLGRAMGWADDPAFNRTMQTFYDEFLKERDFTIDEFKNTGWYYVEPKTWEEDVYSKGKLPTPSGKFQFASEELLHDHGYAAPHYTDDPESLQGDPALIEKYPLALLSASAKEYLNGCFGNMADNNILFGEDCVLMSPASAKARGISNGDKVIVYNDRGTLHRKAYLVDNFLHDDTVFIYPDRWTNFTDVETVNDITPDARADIGRGVTFQSCMVEVKPA